MATTFLPSQIGEVSSDHLPYTGETSSLLYHDLALVLKYFTFVPGILLPWNTWPSGPLDELYPSAKNIYCVVIHTFLVLFQFAFLVSLFFSLAFPFGWVCLYVIVVILVNRSFCALLNQGASGLTSSVEIEDDGSHDDEYWIFLNGVAVGKHWMQANLDRLALTFRRTIHGVHNPTTGIIFDLFQCIVERVFCYCTQDVRDSYSLIKAALLNDKYRKVILVLHSQGGLEGSLIIDWLLDEIPRDVLGRLEVYTFGCAANHFNNPHHKLGTLREDSKKGSSGRLSKAIRHIEHYANSGDFVSRWGVLSFTSVSGRFEGRLFARPGRGHLFNQHYLNSMFPLDKERKKVVENEGLMNMEVALAPNEDDNPPKKGMSRRESLISSLHTGHNVPAEETAIEAYRIRTRDLSRLWAYRNGMVPDD
ncbi:hypothetical protein BDY21DRAFT_316655 [Lineolata rhizophorae]|uniref:DUF676 domain-containing protein n=1 Tax=Lineolata rhizophorae TaxID=578093 RepID=A0A6A6P836_9PEZI|nr:hypothetical protein BDY21DRAFT_316655 [Lineolata rhizophorae]